MPHVTDVDAFPNVNAEKPSLKITFLRPVWRAKLRATARVVRAGKIFGLVECDVFDEQDRFVARASSLPDAAGTVRRRTPASDAPNARI